MILKSTGSDGTVRLFSICEISPLLTPAFWASCSSVMFFCVLFVLILSPISRRSSSFIRGANVFVQSRVILGSHKTHNLLILALYRNNMLYRPLKNHHNGKEICRCSRTLGCSPWDL